MNQRRIEYLKSYEDFWDILDGQQLGGMEKFQLFRLHNCRFYNQEFYSTHRPSTLMLDVEDNRKDTNVLFEDVLNFCLSTDVCKSLGVSMLELLSMDLASYTAVKEAVIKNNEERSAILAKADRESKENQKKILGGL